MTEDKKPKKKPSAVSRAKRAAKEFAGDPDRAARKEALDRKYQDQPVMVGFHHVTKSYKLFKNDKQRFKAIFRKNVPYKQVNAINNMSFRVRKGESVALLGRNGAGKSTMLKMITEVAFPTKGEIEVNGRVSALLELTAGFDPEFTG
ncbi:MAG TPA: hypothetical protein DCS59_06720, partial [Eubacterium sp.]|nr:hypothetical protein [Eubacterium sp.]